ncbi:MAG: hypothetical protein EXS55_03710 [Candidatus Magasanikbacteria bacterium]|nr:hypothetical protein [Candidatus Magasanikbacteria bacterium]
MGLKIKAVLIAGGAILIFVFVTGMNYRVPPEIIRSPDPRLHTPSIQVELVNDSTADIAKRLQDTLRKIDHPMNLFGLGLATPQIGENQRIIIVKDHYQEYITMINPEITEKRWLMPWTERCLSTKGRYFLKRYMWVKVNYQKIDGLKKEKTFFGPKAAILQQEINHLNGVLISDK